MTRPATASPATSDSRDLEAHFGTHREGRAVKTRTIRPDGRILENIPESLGSYAIAEMAIPSYFHKNPFVRYIITARLNEILRIGGPCDTDVVLDFGTGTGILLPELARSAREVIGTDLRTEIARRMMGFQSCANVRIIELDEFRRLPKGSVSKIVAADVLEHVPDLDALLEEFASLLEPGGKLIISGPTENWFYKLCRKIAGFTGEYHVRSVFDIEARLAEKGWETRVRRLLPRWSPVKMFVVFVCTAPQ